MQSNGRLNAAAPAYQIAGDSGSEWCLGALTLRRPWGTNHVRPDSFYKRLTAFTLHNAGTEKYHLSTNNTTSNTLPSLHKPGCYHVIYYRFPAKFLLTQRAPATLKLPEFRLAISARLQS